MSASLQDSHILLRPHELSDLDPLFEAVRESIPQISPWLPWCHSAISKDELAGFIEISLSGWKERSQFQFAIVDANTGVFLGGISLNHWAKSNRLANMGYWVRTSATKRGIASEAVRLVAAFGFQEVGLTRIEIAAIPTNVASRRVAERAGAKFETVVRNRLVMHGKAYDAALYSIVPADLVDADLRGVVAPSMENLMDASARVGGRRVEATMRTADGDALSLRHLQDRQV